MRLPCLLGRPGGWPPGRQHAGATLCLACARYVGARQAEPVFGHWRTWRCNRKRAQHNMPRVVPPALPCLAHAQSLKGTPSLPLSSMCHSAVPLMFASVCLCRRCTACYKARRRQSCRRCGGTTRCGGAGASGRLGRAATDLPAGSSCNHLTIAFERLKGGCPVAPPRSAAAAARSAVRSGGGGGEGLPANVACFFAQLPRAADFFGQPP